MRNRFILKVYSDCETCKGEGFIFTGMKAGFNVKSMEVTAEDDGYDCPECIERSRDEYEYAMEQKSEEKRGN